LDKHTGAEAAIALGRARHLRGDGNFYGRARRTIAGMAERGGPDAKPHIDVQHAGDIGRLLEGIESLSGNAGRGIADAESLTWKHRSELTRRTEQVARKPLA